MGVSRRSANFFRVFAAWTVFVWVTFIRNISRDHTHGTAFKAVHITLALISLAFAVGAFVVVSRTRRSVQADGPSGAPEQTVGAGSHAPEVPAETSGLAAR